MKKCISCGYENEDDREKCANCGEPLTKTERTEPEVPTQSSRFQNILLSSQFLSVLLCALVISIMAVIFFSFQIAMLGFDASILMADIVFIVFFGIVILISLGLWIARICIKYKRNKK